MVFVTPKRANYLKFLPSEKRNVLSNYKFTIEAYGWGLLLLLAVILANSTIDFIQSAKKTETLTQKLETRNIKIL